MIQSLLIANHGEIACRINRIARATGMMLVVALSISSALASAASSDRSLIRYAVSNYFVAITGRGGDQYFRATWPDSPLGRAHNPFGPIVHDDWSLNDIKIWVTGKRAVVSVHTTEFRYDPEGSRSRRDLCRRQIKLEKRGREWRLFEVTHVHCNLFGNEMAKR